MTIYVSDTPYEDRFFVWADTPDELFMGLAALGALDAPACPTHNAWDGRMITGEQLAAALGLGFTLTDRFGPAEWCARRDNNARLLEMILRARG